MLGLDVLDQACLGQQGVDLAVGWQELDVGDFGDPVADAAVGRGRFLEIGAGPTAQVLGLADIDHPPGASFIK